MNRPPFIVSTRDVEEKIARYPNKEEEFTRHRPIGAAAGLERIGLHVERILPGHRSTLPHAEADEEEFVFVLEGEIDAWIDGERYPMKKGDLAAFPAGTGIAHTFINDGDVEAVLFVGGEKSKPGNRIVYPLNPERAAEMKPGAWWEDAPKRPMGNAPAVPRRK